VRDLVCPAAGNATSVYKFLSITCLDKHPPAPGEGGFDATLHQRFAPTLSCARAKCVVVRAAFCCIDLQGLQFCGVTVRMPTRYVSKRAAFFGAKCATALRRHNNLVFPAIVHWFVGQLTISRSLWLWSRTHLIKMLYLLLLIMCAGTADSTLAAVIAAPICAAVALAGGLLLWWWCRRRRHVRSSGSGKAHADLEVDTEKGGASEATHDDLGPHVRSQRERSWRYSRFMPLPACLPFLKAHHYMAFAASPMSMRCMPFLMHANYA
jgi:hypothetical protein